MYWCVPLQKRSGNVIVFLGNESPLGIPKQPIVFENARRLNALVVLVEHRYYGELGCVLYLMVFGISLQQQQQQQQRKCATSCSGGANQPNPSPVPLVASYCCVLWCEKYRSAV
jgi:hypothetical protein